ncbi:hypothetical protein WH47_03988, partial [Habropoda laboriosa]
ITTFFRAKLNNMNVDDIWFQQDGATHQRKSKVYANNPKTIDELRNNITDAINETVFQLCENVMENWVKRIGRTQKNRGGHLNDIVFHN